MNSSYGRTPRNSKRKDRAQTLQRKAIRANKYGV